MRGKRGRNRIGKSFFVISWHKTRLCWKRTLSGRPGNVCLFKLADDIGMFGIAWEKFFSGKDSINMRVMCPRLLTLSPSRVSPSVVRWEYPAFSIRPCGTAASRYPACPSVQVPIGREAYLAGFPELARSRSRPGPGIPALLVESAAGRHGSLPPRPQGATSTCSRVQGQGFVRGRGEGMPVGGVRLSVRGRTLAGVRPAPQCEAVEVESAVGCSCAGRTGLNGKPMV